MTFFEPSIVATGLLVVLLIADAERSSGERAGTTEVMKFSPAAKLLGGILGPGTLMMFLALFAIPENRNLSAVLHVAPVFLLTIQLPGWWYFLRALYSELRLSEEGILLQRRGRTVTFIPWRDVQTVKMNAMWGRYEVEGSERKVAVSQFLNGQRAFAEAVLGRVPCGRIICADALRRLATLGTPPMERSTAEDEKGTDESDADADDSESKESD